MRSLTIREGISRCKNELTTCRKFPHYTWGYITRLIRCKPVWRVPSLYVRVYHLSFSSFVFPWSSLTIREGISFKPLYHSAKSPFHHYTWGYIIEFKGDKFSIIVPSLYVRVYRKEMQKKTQKLRSLIICEGILVIFASFRITHIKNVKIFQKNTKKGNQKYE